MTVTRHTPLTELPQLLTVSEYATWAGIGLSLAYEQARRGEVPAVRFGRLLRIPREALVEIIAGRFPAAREVRR